MDRSALFSGDGGFFQQHHGNFVSNRINTPTGRALEPATIRGQMDRRLALRTNENVEQILRDSQLNSPRCLHGRYWHCTKSGRGRANVACFASWYQGSACATYEATKMGVPR